MTTAILYGVTVLLLLLSLVKDRQKTKQSLVKAWKSFENMLPQLLVVVLVVGVLLALVNAETISGILGADSGWLGVLLSAVVGSVTLIPGFVAFPMAAMLLGGGAGAMQIGAFVSSLMMVGVVTFPIETRYFGKKTAAVRNLLAFFFSFAVAYVIGRVVGP